MPRKTGAVAGGGGRADRASMRPRPDAAENRRARPRHAACARRFNEAAARCRGKPAPSIRMSAIRVFASMRPRPDAAENGRPRLRRNEWPGCFNEAAARCRGKLSRRSEAKSSPCRFNEAAARCRGKRDMEEEEWRYGGGASMRPRPDAAENPHRLPGPAGPGAASMRPRPDAAENGIVADRGGGAGGGASMRPRPDAAENVKASATGAAPGGASMRPRPDAAENPSAQLRAARSAECFNEAAARCRGKRRAAPRAARRRRRRFNEAAARCRGKRRIGTNVPIRPAPLQ